MRKPPRYFMVHNGDGDAWRFDAVADAVALIVRAEIENPTGYELYEMDEDHLWIDETDTLEEAVRVEWETVREEEAADRADFSMMAGWR